MSHLPDSPTHWDSTALGYLLGEFYWNSNLTALWDMRSFLAEKKIEIVEAEFSRLRYVLTFAQVLRGCLSLNWGP